MNGKCEICGKEAELRCVQDILVCTSCEPAAPKVAALKHEKYEADGAVKQLQGIICGLCAEEPWTCGSTPTDCRPRNITLYSREVVSPKADPEIIAKRCGYGLPVWEREDQYPQSREIVGYRCGQNKTCPCGDFVPKKHPNEVLYREHREPKDCDHSTLDAESYDYRCDFGIAACPCERFLKRKGK